MAQLAIKGHPEKGNEVIERLEMLGGINSHNLYGDENYAYYTIDSDKEIKGGIYIFGDEQLCLYTLEEFEEKFPYKVGDKVRNAKINDFIGKIINTRWDNNEEQIIYTVEWDDVTKSTLTYYTRGLQPYKEEWTMKNKSKLINIEPKLVGNECVHFPIPTDMKLEVKDGMYYLYKDCGELIEYLDNATPEQLEEDWKELEKFSEVGPVADEYVKQCKKDNKTTGSRIDFSLTERIELDLGDTHEVVVENGKTYVVKKKPTYPNTYEEYFNRCFGNKHHIVQVVGLDGLGNNKELFEKFIKLKICRDAYWKIAGEEMGLGKPWKPDWNDEDETKYVIFNLQNKIKLATREVVNAILAFPTEEMRDAFYENFKDLINECKELL